jgi:hypothetical protein
VEKFNVNTKIYAVSPNFVNYGLFIKSGAGHIFGACFSMWKFETRKLIWPSYLTHVELADIYLLYLLYKNNEFCSRTILKFWVPVPMA